MQDIPNFDQYKFGKVGFVRTLNGIADTNTDYATYYWANTDGAFFQFDTPVSIYAAKVTYQILNYSVDFVNANINSAFWLVYFNRTGQDGIFATPPGAYTNGASTTGQTTAFLLRTWEGEKWFNFPDPLSAVDQIAIGEGQLRTLMSTTPGSGPTGSLAILVEVYLAYK